MVEPTPTNVHRIRMTFPLTVPVATVEAAVADVARGLATSAPGTSAPRLEVTDVSATTWDGAVILQSPEADPAALRDRVLRAVIARHPAAGRTTA